MNSRAATTPWDWGDNEDFVEFYNPGRADVDLGGYFLSDNPANPDKFEILQAQGSGRGYLMVMCSAEGLLTNLYCRGILEHQLQNQPVSR